MIKKILCLGAIIFLFGCEKKETDLEQATKTVDKFYIYDSNSSYDSISNLMSVNFFKVVPNYKFIGIMKNKKEILGNFKNKVIDKHIDTVVQNSKVFRITYKVEYSNKNTVESFVLEKSDNQYKILKYNID